ncbi:hypothetical protein BU26DRAFT_26 [Trematosphaeria pertusa]|uniref:Uncharacterized protein n=1 Tax=Trematosphaeria pertusa TaxID=390896 RepID=A0A6A6IYW2_9PLEO|nr:uncharacterized protein BU26DRAFT_26 [Trematosphaeria pertusa]KAF2255488.1 hypothetical protein BU26DRAFT_26 [Trematosphaeria pertusa]
MMLLHLTSRTPTGHTPMRHDAPSRIPHTADMCLSLLSSPSACSMCGSALDPRLPTTLNPENATTTSKHYSRTDATSRAVETRSTQQRHLRLFDAGEEASTTLSSPRCGFPRSRTKFPPMEQPQPASRSVIPRHQGPSSL